MPARKAPKRFVATRSRAKKRTSATGRLFLPTDAYSDQISSNLDVYANKAYAFNDGGVFQTYTKPYLGGPARAAAAARPRANVQMPLPPPVPIMRPPANVQMPLPPPPGVRVPIRRPPVNMNMPPPPPQPRKRPRDDTMPLPRRARARPDDLEILLGKPPAHPIKSFTDGQWILNNLHNHRDIVDDPRKMRQIYDRLQDEDSFLHLVHAIGSMEEASQKRKRAGQGRKCACK